MGKSTGHSKGKAGSMHLAAPEQGIMGASAVVAASVSHAMGYALAASWQQRNARKTSIATLISLD